MWTTMDSTKIIFHWRPASDVETPQATLSYNLMVGTSPKGIDITSPFLIRLPVFVGWWSWAMLN
jgi:hypothetical protein